MTRSSESCSASPPAAPPFWFLAITAACCGALVMVIEVLGARVIGPFFGVSLFVWTALISVTMIALALGYWAGGVFSARGRTADLLYGAILASGVGSLLVPLLKGAVLLAARGLGLRTGAFVSALVLFGPPLFFLGCVSPLLVRLAARELDRVGRTAGLLYAISTLGSVAGTLVTGFFLIGWVGIDRVFLLAGAALLGLGCSWFLMRRRHAVLGLLLLLPFAWAGADAIARPRPLPSGAVSVHREDTFYGTLRVVDRVSEVAHERELRIDGQNQGSIDLRTGLPLSEIMYFLEFLPRAVNPAGRDCLVVGLGSGAVPRWFASEGVRTEVVEINPRVAALAREYFGFPGDLPVTIADARAFLHATPRRYDYLVLDVFNGDTTPEHLLSLEAFRLAKTRLAPGGVLVMNAAGSLLHETEMTASLLATVRSVFATVECYPLFDPRIEPGWGNMAVLAYDAPAPAVRSWPARLTSIHPEAYPVVQKHLRTQYAFPPGTPSLVLTDDHNPYEMRGLWLKEQARNEVLRSTEPELLF